MSDAAPSDEPSRSWWLAPMTREAFMQTAAREAETRMSRSREARRHTPMTVDYLTPTARAGSTRG